jgi:hypothetical protein
MESQKAQQVVFRLIAAVYVLYIGISAYGYTGRYFDIYVAVSIGLVAYLAGRLDKLLEDRADAQRLYQGNGAAKIRKSTPSKE